MNTLDDNDDALHDEFLRAMGDEPVMRSLPDDDLVRGKRLVRRRRLAAVTVAAVAVPVVALGGWQLSGNLGGHSAPGAELSQLQPAGSSDNDPTASCAQVNVGGGFSGGAVSRGAVSPPNLGSSHRVRGSGKSAMVTSSKGSVRMMKGPQPPDGKASGSASRCDDSGTGGSAVSSECPVSSSGGGARGASGDTGAASSGAEKTSCDAVPGDPSSPPGVDRVTGVLQGLDPDQTHTGGSLLTGGAVDSGSGPSALYAGMDWVDGALEGAVAVSVEDAATAGPDSDCQDHAIADGPTVTCVEQTLADGTTVLVGHGEQDGAERVTVRYDRPDGTVVTATADEATDKWWTEGSGPAPLTDPPVTVQQLIGLVQAPELHL